MGNDTIVPFTIHIHPKSLSCLWPDREVWTTPAERQTSREFFLGIFEVYWARAIPSLWFFCGPGQWPEKIYEWRYFHPNIFAKDPRFWPKKRDEFLSRLESQSILCDGWLNQKKQTPIPPTDPEGFKNIHHCSPKQWSTATCHIMP